MAGDGELKKIRKDLQRNRDEIAALQRRIQALIEKRRGPAKKSSDKPKGE
jgi:hypothetical protein